MTREAYAYIAGGAGLEGTIDANRAAFDRRRIVPRMMRDVSERDLSVELFGRRLPTPFLIAPIGVLELAHRDADVAVAKAAASEGVPMIFSNQASRSMEDCAGAMGDAPRWFQLYWSTSNELVASFVGARRGVRLRGDRRHARHDDARLALPRPRPRLPAVRGRQGDRAVHERPGVSQPAEAGEARVAGRPTLKGVRSLLEVNDAYPGGVFENMRSGIGDRGRPHVPVDLLTPVADLGRPAVPARADEAADPAQGDPASGGRPARGRARGGRDRRLERTAAGRSTARSARWIRSRGWSQRSTAASRCCFDSGIRGGADAFKALALGARAVLIGRPYVYGLALAGEDGVRDVLQNFAADLDLTMGLAGCRSIVGDRAAISRVGAVKVEIYYCPV